MQLPIVYHMPSLERTRLEWTSDCCLQIELWLWRVWILSYDITGTKKATGQPIVPRMNFQLSVCNQCYTEYCTLTLKCMCTSYLLFLDFAFLRIHLFVPLSERASRKYCCYTAAKKSKTSASFRKDWKPGKSSHILWLSDIPLSKPPKARRLGPR